MNINVTDAKIYPIQLDYKKDKNLKIKSEFITFKDGFSFFAHPLMKSFKDSTINKNTNLMLTKALQFFEIFEEPVNLNITFGGYTKLSFKNDYTVTVQPNDKLYLTSNNSRNTTDSNMFCLVYNEIDSTFNILHDNKYVTVRDSYPFDLYMDLEHKKYNKSSQKFKIYLATNNEIYLTTYLDNDRNIISGNQKIEQFISYEKSNLELRANGIITDDDYEYNNPYIFKIDNIQINFEATGLTQDSCWAAYYNSVISKENNKNVEISYIIPELQVNRLIDLPYNGKINIDTNLKIATGEVNIANLKNILTPDNRYSIKMIINIQNGIGYWYCYNPANPGLLDLIVS